MMELKVNSTKLVAEERDAHQIERKVGLVVEPSEVTANKTTCLQSTGDGYQKATFLYSNFDGSNNELAASLCSVDKMRIGHLISELNKCKKLKKDTELLLEESKNERKLIQEKFELFYSINEDEKANLKLKLSSDIRILKELTTNSSYGLEILADQISAWEVETASIRDTVDQLLDQKINLLNKIGKMEVKIMLLTAEESEIENNRKMKELCFRKQKLKADITMILTFDRGCQTEQGALQ